MKSLPLRRLFERKKVLGHVHEPMLSVYREQGVVLKDERINHNKTAEDRTIYQLVDDGWLVVNRMKAWQGALGISTMRGIVSGHYICFEPIHQENNRFLHYALRSPRMTAHFASISRGVRTGQIEIDNDDLAVTQVPIPSREEQGRIAGFLDDRIARIDRIIVARGEQLSLTAQIPWIEFGRDLVGAPQVPLRRALGALADGPFGSAYSSSDYVDDGPAVIRLGNIGFARFRATELARVTPEIYERFPLAHIRQGDLLIASLGDANNHAGRACLAPVELGTAMVKGKCFVARANPAVSTEHFLSILLSSPTGAEALVQQGTGATRSMLNFERLRACILPIPDLDAQALLIAKFEASRESTSTTVAHLTRSIELLTEYKSSLITAAVNGELDVTTAGSEIPA